MNPFRSGRLFSAVASVFFIATVGVAFNGCGSSAATSAVPTRQPEGNVRHVKDAAAPGGPSDPTEPPGSPVNWSPPTPVPATSPPDPACNGLSPSSSCFGPGASPPTPNLNPQFIDQFGMACDPMNPKKTMDGSMQVCSLNPGWDSSGTPLNPVHNGIDLSNYQPQCTDIYGSLMNSASYHQCYKMRMWVN